MPSIAARIAVGAALLILGTVAAAQPETPASFLRIATQTGLMEVEAARLAVRVSENSAVREFAYRVIHDHGRMNEDLERISRKLGVAMTAELDPEHAARLQSLRDTPARSFDAAYLTRLAADRATRVELLQSNLLNPDTELAVFSSYNLPMAKEHKRLADELRETLRP